MKLLNLRSHVVGEDCKCKRFKCFKNVPEMARMNVIRQFNSFNSIDEQNIYLCSLISVMQVKQRRPRKEKEHVKFHYASYHYRIRFSNNEGKLGEVSVCCKAFLSIHGIGRKKLQFLQLSLREKGKAPRDRS